MMMKKAAAWAGRIFAKLRLLFMLHFMFDRVVRAENLKWQQRDKENKGKYLLDIMSRSGKERYGIFQFIGTADGQIWLY